MYVPGILGSDDQMSVHLIQFTSSLPTAFHILGKYCGEWPCSLFCYVQSVTTSPFVERLNMCRCLESIVSGNMLESRFYHVVYRNGDQMTCQDSEHMILCWSWMSVFHAEKFTLFTGKLSSQKFPKAFPPGLSISRPALVYAVNVGLELEA